MEKKKSILLVDDHDAILEGISFALQKKYSEAKIYKALHVADADELLNQNQLDIIIADISFKEAHNTDGIAFCKKVVKKGGSKVISYTGFYQLKNLKQLLHAGVDAIVSKNDGNKALINAIDAVLLNQKYYSFSVLSEFSHLIESRKNIRNNKPQLTKRQSEIVDLIAQAKNNQEIANILCISKGTVEGHITNIALNIGLERADRVAILHKLGRIL